MSGSVRSSDVVNWNVGARGFETVGAGGVVDSLDGTMVVHVRVASPGLAVGVTGLSLGGSAVGVTVSVLAVFILRVELALDRCHCYGWGGGVHVWDRGGGVDVWGWSCGVGEHRCGHYCGFVVTDDAGVGSGDRGWCWGGGQVVRGRSCQVVDDRGGRGNEFCVLDGDDVGGGGGGGVTGNEWVRVESGATLLAGGQDDGVLGVVHVHCSGGRQGLGELEKWVSGGHEVRRALDDDRLGRLWRPMVHRSGGVVDDGHGGTVNDWHGGSGVDGVGVGWQVGATDAETVDRVGHVGQRLDKAVGVHIRVTAAGHAVSGALFVLGRWAAGVTVSVLAQFVLRVVLGGDRCVVHWVHGTSTDHCHNGCCE